MYRKAIGTEKKNGGAYLSPRQGTRLKNILITFGACLIWLGVWQAAAMKLGEDILLASPVDVIVKLKELMGARDYWTRVLFSSLRVTEGLLAGLLAGALLGAAAFFIKAVRDLLKPLVTVIRAIPVASFIILALLWIGEESLGAFISFLISFPVFYTNTIAGFGGADVRLLEMSRVFRLSFGKKLRAVYLPSVIRSASGALEVAVGLAWKSGTAAEVIAVPAGSIGEKLYRAKIYLMNGDMLAWTLTIVLLSGLMTYLLRCAMRLINRLWGDGRE